MDRTALPALDLSRAKPGATVRTDGVVFGIDASLAECVELCIFDGGNERRLSMSRRTDGLFVTHVPGAGVGSRYGFRVHGPWDPARGHRCNPAKLLLDPYALHIEGEVGNHPAVYGHDLADPDQASSLDSAPHTMRSVVAASEFDWEGVDKPRIPMSDSVIYETHVKGFSRNHPDVPSEIRGTYAALGHPAILDHLTRLGVTAVELLPIHQFVQDQHLLQTGRRNYWGYNSIGFFAPYHGYAAGDDPVAEFKGAVKALHASGIEVILDVVYNHTAEGNHLGPTLSFRGIDNPSWYRLDPSDPSRYLNWTGTGNTVNLGHQAPLRMVLDSLRYWALEMGVDGFRFDLASVLGRTHGDFDPWGAFFGAVASDPVLRDVKLIAEPWDVGPGGYRVGGFPDGWSEWNDQYRDVVRDFWRSHEGMLATFATRITGSVDIYGRRRPTASVNLITSHDGYTLADLVSYERRHNRANGENNEDGHRDNRSWNSGVEGPSDDPEIRRLRARRSRSFLMTLLLSQGVPMLLGGDELGRTQKGNNNAYNQDNATSWYAWAEADQSLIEFTSRVVSLRRSHPTFRRTEWLHEHPDPGIDQVGWFTPAGEEMTPRDWRMPFARSIALYLRGHVIHTAAGTESDDDFLLLFNAYDQEMIFVIPAQIDGEGPWTIVADTDRPGVGAMVAGDSVVVAGFGVMVLQRASQSTHAPPTTS